MSTLQRNTSQTSQRLRKLSDTIRNVFAPKPEPRRRPSYRDGQPVPKDDIVLARRPSLSMLTHERARSVDDVSRSTPAPAVSRPRKLHRQRPAHLMYPGILTPYEDYFDKKGRARIKIQPNTALSQTQGSPSTAGAGRDRATRKDPEEKPIPFPSPSADLKKTRAQESAGGQQPSKTPFFSPFATSPSVPRDRPAASSTVAKTRAVPSHSPALAEDKSPRHLKQVAPRAAAEAKVPTSAHRSKDASSVRMQTQMASPLQQSDERHKHKRDHTSPVPFPADSARAVNRPQAKGKGKERPVPVPLLDLQKKQAIEGWLVSSSPLLTSSSSSPRGRPVASTPMSARAIAMNATTPDSLTPAASAARQPSSTSPDARQSVYCSTDAPTVRRHGAVRCSSSSDEADLPPDHARAYRAKLKVERAARHARKANGLERSHDSSASIAANPDESPRHGHGQHYKHQEAGSVDDGYLFTVEDGDVIPLATRAAQKEVEAAVILKASNAQRDVRITASDTATRDALAVNGSTSPVVRRMASHKAEVLHVWPAERVEDRQHPVPKLEGEEGREVKASHSKPSGSSAGTARRAEPRDVRMDTMRSSPTRPLNIRKKREGREEHGTANGSERPYRQQ